MDLFTVIDDAHAIVRMPKGVFKQVKVFHRLGRIYVGVAGGFVRVTAAFGGSFGTSHPTIKVEAFSAPVAASILTDKSEPTYEAVPGPRAVAA